MFLGWIPLWGQEKEGSAAFVYDLGDTSGNPWPAWLTPVATPAGSTLTEIAYDVARPPGAPSSDLLLTVVFDEGHATLLRVFRQDGPASAMVAENLSEGTGLLNQRTLLLRDVGAGDLTRIVIQSDGPAQPLRRLVWEWPRPEAVAVSGEAPALLRHRVALSAQEVSGDPLPAPRPNVGVDYTFTPLLDRPARIDGTASFGADLDEAPAHARLVARILGLPLDRQLDCWVNGRRIGAFAAALPSLQDPAYLLPSGGDAALASWREASVYVPASAWRDGENQIEFRRAATGAPDSGAYALKDVVLELAYQEPSASSPLSSHPPTPQP